MSKNHTFLVQTINAASYRIRRAATETKIVVGTNKAYPAT
jgi:hypothetical protein